MDSLHDVLHCGVSAQGTMGCACEGQRLAALVAVMADNEIFEEEALKNPFDYDKRPVHVAFLNKKLPCPHQFCSKNLIFSPQQPG